MASLEKVKRKNGTAWRIRLSNGEKRTGIVLGKMPKKTAELCLSMIKQIAVANAAGQSYSVEVATWTQNIEDDLHAKLVNAGLLRQRQRRTLGAFLDDYIKEHTHWKERTASAFKTSKNLILDFFGEGTSIEKISVDDAVAFRLKLELELEKKKNGKKKYAEATIAKIIGHCRQVFNLAKRRKLIADSPFETVKKGSQRNPARLYPVSMGEYQQLLEGCTNAKQRLIIALARIGGLRIVSELCGLRWSEIDWAEKWFWVHSPKTEHHEGGDKRKVPLFPELERRFEELYETLPEKCDDLVFPEESDIPPTINPKKSLSSWIHKVAKRAGVKLWEKPFQNMRSTRATELRKKRPAHEVNRWLGRTQEVAEEQLALDVNCWLGHTQKVAEDHYIQELPEDFLDAYNAEKNGAKTGAEHAGIGCFGIEGLLSAATDRVPFDATMARVCKELFGNPEESVNVQSRLGRT